MSLFSRGIVAAMEDEMANQELAIDEAGADSMEADLVEGVNLTNNICQGMKVISGTLDDAGQLERHIELLVATEDSGYESGVIKSTIISVEAIYDRLGIKKENKISLESFSKERPREQARRIVASCEGVLSTIWEAVTNAIKKLIEWVKRFFNWVFGTNDKVSSRIETLEKKQEVIENKKESPAPKQSTDTPTTEKKESPAPKQSTDTPTTSKKESPAQSVAGDGISDVLNITKFSDYGTDEEHNVINIIRDASKFIDEKRSLVSSFNSLSEIEKNFSFKGGKGDKFAWPSSDGFTWYKLVDCNTFELAQLLPTSDKKGRDAIAAAGKFRLKENRKKGKIVELPTLTNEEIHKALKIAKEITSEVDDNASFEKEAEKFLEDSLKNVDKIADRFKDILHGKAEGDLRKEIDAIRAAVTALVMESIKIAIVPLSDLKIRSAALLKYVERSQKAI